MTTSRRRSECLCYFHERALDCCEPVAEKVLVDVCLHDMLEDYRIFSEDLSFPSFSKLMEVDYGTNESVHRTSRSSPVVRPNN